VDPAVSGDGQAKKRRWREEDARCVDSLGMRCLLLLHNDMRAKCK